MLDDCRARAAALGRAFRMSCAVALSVRNGLELRLRLAAVAATEPIAGVQLPASADTSASDLHENSWYELPKSHQWLLPRQRLQIDTKQLPEASKIHTAYASSTFLSPVQIKPSRTDLGYIHAMHHARPENCIPRTCNM
eukprot:1681314-Pleurochrysis_carterae.AAC.6